LSASQGRNGAEWRVWYGDGYNSIPGRLAPAWAGEDPWLVDAYRAAGICRPVLTRARCISMAAVISGTLRAIEISETSI